MGMGMIRWEWEWNGILEHESHSRIPLVQLWLLGVILQDGKSGNKQFSYDRSQIDESTHYRYLTIPHASYFRNDTSIK